MSPSFPSRAPPTDDDLAGIVQGGAGGLGIALERLQVARLVAYLRLVERWNLTYNLTAVRDPNAMATQHVVDSMSIIPSLRTRLQGGRRRILDVGSGAGLPGVVIAILQPGDAVVCVDSVGKKAAFVTQVAASLKLGNLTSIHARIETLPRPPTYDFIVSRAFASLVDMVISTRHLLAEGGWWIAMKGKVPHEEMQDAERAGAIFAVEQINVPDLDADRCLLIGRPSQASEHQL